MSVMPQPGELYRVRQPFLFKSRPLYSSTSESVFEIFNEDMIVMIVAVEFPDSFKRTMCIKVLEDEKVFTISKIKSTSFYKFFTRLM